jgi:hypothetical protein
MLQGTDPGAERSVWIVNGNLQCLHSTTHTHPPSCIFIFMSMHTPALMTPHAPGRPLWIQHLCSAPQPLLRSGPNGHTSHDKVTGCSRIDNA